jgi:hypothetical protein
MKKKEAFKLVIGSIAVHVAVACGSAVSTGFTPVAGGDDASTPSSRENGGGLTDTGMSLGDALTNPVATAKAGGNASGSRLKPEYYAGSDGSKMAFRKS